MIPEYLQSYSQDQLRVILDERPIKQVVAAAGSGKTRTVVGLVEHGLRSGRERRGRILLLSFSRKAVGELRERVPVDLRDAVEISTFHSFCFRWLARLDPERRGRIRVWPEEEKRRFLYAEMRKHRDELGGLPFGMLLDAPREFRRCFPEAAMRVFRACYAYKEKNGLSEYEDLIADMLRGLERGASFLRDLRAGYDLVIVDEFQDTDPGQLRFLELLRPPRLVVVGDDWQAIYAFRGATVEPFLNFRKVFREARVYRLVENFRSGKEIVRLGNRVIRASRRQLRKRVRSARGPGAGIPVLALALERGREDRLLEVLREPELVGSAQGESSPIPADLDFRILVRTNQRREAWMRAGVPGDQILTIHKSKGLEFSVVFLDLMDGWSAARRPEGERFRPEDEEIRVLYVGGSRARDALVLLRRPSYAETAAEHYYWERLYAGRVRDCRLAEVRSWLARVRESRVRIK